MLCSTGIRPLEAIEQKDGCWEKLTGHLIDSLRPVLEVNESTKSENAHLPVVEAVRGSNTFVPLEAHSFIVRYQNCSCTVVQIHIKLLPKEAVDIFEPLGYKVVSDGLSVVWKA